MRVLDIAHLYGMGQDSRIVVGIALAFYKYIHVGLDCCMLMLRLNIMLMNHGQQTMTPAKSTRYHQKHPHIHLKCH